MLSLCIPDTTILASITMVQINENLVLRWQAGIFGCNGLVLWWCFGVLILLTHKAPWKIRFKGIGVSQVETQFTWTIE